PWAAVAAAAKLRGLWRNEPGFGGTRDPWAAVAAAARLGGPVRRSPKGEGGVWQNKPDFGRARLQRAAVAAARRRAPVRRSPKGEGGVRQNEADVAGAPAPMCASPDRASSTIVRSDDRPHSHPRFLRAHAAPHAARLARPRDRLALSRLLRPRHGD